MALISPGQTAFWTENRPATGKIEKGVTESGPSSSMLITQGPAAGLPKIVG